MSAHAIPLTSLDSGDRVKGEHSFVTACASQAQIALIHLRRVWARESEPAGQEVWNAVLDPLEVWADLQGALTAGIVLSRLLKPQAVRPRPPLSKAQSVANSNTRGDRLRRLLGVSDESVLLTIRAVRNPVEHIDAPPAVDREAGRDLTEHALCRIDRGGLMTTWNTEELARIAEPEMFDLSAQLEDGTTPKTVGIWAVAVDGRLFVRSYTGLEGKWYAPALASLRGRVSAGGVTKDVRFERITDEAINSAIDAEYLRKYTPSPYAPEMGQEPVRSNTLEVIPLD